VLHLIKTMISISLFLDCYAPGFFFVTWHHIKWLLKSCCTCPNGVIGGNGFVRYLVGFHSLDPIFFNFNPTSYMQ
jgi:hypothetical protein